MKSESHRIPTTPALREYLATYCSNVMSMGVIISVEFVVEYVIDPGGWHRIS